MCAEQTDGRAKVASTPSSPTPLPVGYNPQQQLEQFQGVSKNPY